MKFLFGLMLLLTTTSCLLQEGKLELRPDHIDARIALFKSVDATVTGPFVRYSTEFEFVEDGLTEEQIAGLQGFVVYKNGVELGPIQINATSFGSGQSLVGDRVCFRLGMNLLINGEEIKTLPGTAEICN